MGQDVDKLQDAFDSLKRVHNAANIANDKFILDMDELQKENQYLKNLLTNAENALTIQKTIVGNLVQSSQEKHERDYAEIELLKQEIRELKGK